jgi:hypothetical protein
MSKRPPGKLDIESKHLPGYITPMKNFFVSPDDAKKGLSTLTETFLLTQAKREAK